jgi:hypothetical protein
MATQILCALVLRSSRAHVYIHPGYARSDSLERVLSLRTT